MPIAAVMLLAAFAATASPALEPTPIPRDLKPDFSVMQPLAGSWNCKVASSRRPAPFDTVATTGVSADGYWLVTKTVTAKVPWNPIVIVNTDYVTYDRTTSRWIDMSMDDFGAYDVSESKGWNGRSIVWTEITYPKLHGAVSFGSREVTVDAAEGKSVTTSSFIEASGRRVRVTTTCIKRQ